MAGVHHSDAFVVELDGHCRDESITPVFELDGLVGCRDLIDQRATGTAIRPDCCEGERSRQRRCDP